MSGDRANPARVTGRLSRRRLMALSALATAAGALGGARPAAPAAAADGADGADDDAYQRAFQAALTADQNVRSYLRPGREFLYRPRQLLVANADTQRVVARLRAYGHQVRADGGFAGVTRLRFDRETDIPSTVTWLRDPSQWSKMSVPAVQPHHVVLGFGNIMGNPGSPPQVAPALPAPDPTRLGEGAGVTVGICDTGIWREAASFHPQWLGGSYLPESDDEDPIYSHDDVLALQGGHGTFVAGVLRQAAPGVRLDPEQALKPTGLGDEESLVHALQKLTSETSIVNLSLGCFTQDDLPPLPLSNALATVSAETVVVAAAGNAGVSRPAWPAALPTVLAVAAVSRNGQNVEPAPYSGFGPWVDACAVADRTSTYVKGELLLPGRPAKQFLGFAAWSGTSFATPHVAGRLAALMTAHGLTAQQARLALLAQTPWHPDYGVLVE